MKHWETTNSAHTARARKKRKIRNIFSKHKRYVHNYIKTNGFRYDSKGKKTTIKSPEYLCIYNDAPSKNTIRFIHTIRDEAKAQHNIHLDLSSLKLISAAAMLLLLATVDHIKRTMPDVKFSSKYPADEKSESILNQTGFTEVLGRRPNATATFEDVSYWRASTGSDTRPEQSVELFEEIDKAIPDHKKLLYKGFLEVMANSVEHAYAHLKSSMLTRHSRWWAFGGIKDDKVVLLVCDLGAGIPNTLPKVIEPSWLDKTLKLIGVTTHNDAELIQAATMLRETATKKQNRGKGLNDAKKSVDSTPGSFLSIHSNRGNYRYHHLMSGKIAGDLRRLNQSIGGTIVEWQLPIGDVA